LNFFATTPKGLELLLVEELKQLGATSAAEKLAGVEFSGDLRMAYKACLWSRLANRILLPLLKIPAATPDELYVGVQKISWDEHLDPAGTIYINFATSQSKINHTLFGAQKVKDAIVDQLRDKYNIRPNISRDQPDVAIHIYLYRDVATISLDLSGESLHRRGYRLDQVAAPLKENLAAAILLRAKWPEVAAKDGMLFDPMCGSGTLLIEAAFIAGKIAPGLQRQYHGFLGWKKHDNAIWQSLLTDANLQRVQNEKNIPPIVGYDRDPEAIKIAFANIDRAGLRGKIHVEKQALEAAQLTKKTSYGLLVTNPPYGERIGELSELQKLYPFLGQKLKTEFAGWRAAIFTANPDLGKTMGIRAERRYALFNGPIACQLLLFSITPEWFIDRSPAPTNERVIRKAQQYINDLQAPTDSIQMFSNRLQKNLKHINKWVKRENPQCYRIYNEDLPEYPVIIDYYDDNIIIQSFPAAKHVLNEIAYERVQQVLAVLPELLVIKPAKIYYYAYPQTADIENLFPNFNEKITHPPR
jgi:23S rRNA (guanine2445-N2)-methyltransferase / 23S rRNA (guanine2069-N7)-methyltransferase